MLLWFKALVNLQVEYYVPCWTWRQKNPKQIGYFDPWAVGRGQKAYLRVRMFVLWKKIEQLYMLILIRHQVQEELIMVSKCLLETCWDLGVRCMQNAAALWNEQLWWLYVYCKFMMCIRKELLFNTARVHLINTDWSD